MSSDLDEHGGGLKGWLAHTFTPHSHGAADRIDDALESSRAGVRAVKVSLIALGATAIAQLAIFAVSGSVALLADTIHNFSDVLTAFPLWIAFVLARRPASRTYTHGFGRVEDVAGVFVLVMIAVSSVIVIVESIRRLAEPQDIHHVWWVFAAGLVGFAGNEAVAAYRIRVGHRIGSAALVADGLHARTDGLTSLAVAAGAVAVWAGFPLADPLIGLLVGLAIVWLLISAARDVGRRLLDGVEPEVEHAVREALTGALGGLPIRELRLRWSGHQLVVAATVECRGESSVAEFTSVALVAAAAVRKAVANVGRVVVTPVAAIPKDAGAAR